MLVCFQTITFMLCLCAVSTCAQEFDQCFSGNSNPQFMGHFKHLKGYILRIDQHKEDTVYKDIVYEQTLCRASVISPGGKVIFQADDAGMKLNEMTGKDLNGDGQADAVFEGFSGGAHCCWTYWIVSLGDHSGLVQEFKNETDVSFYDIDNDGRIEIWTKDGAFEHFDCLSPTDSPLPTVIFRLESRALKDVGQEYKEGYDREIEDAWSTLKTFELDRFRAANYACEGESRETMPKVLRIVLAYLYSGREQAAWQALEQMWPAHGVERIRRQIIDARSAGVLKNIKR